MKDRGVTIVIHTDGDLDSRQYRVPVWAFEAGKWGALVVALLVVLFFAFAGPISRAAARVPGLERQGTRLREEDGQVQQLAAALNRCQEEYQSLRQLLGVRAPPERTSAKLGVELLRAVAVRARSPAASPRDRKSTRLNSSHGYISYAVFCLKKKKYNHLIAELQDPRDPHPRSL